MTDGRGGRALSWRALLRPTRANILLDMADPLPPPGPNHYAARRARWLASPRTPSQPRRIHPSHLRLQRLLNNSDPHSDPVWNRGIDQVWRGLVKGNKLKHRLPMSLVVCTPVSSPLSSRNPSPGKGHPRCLAPRPRNVARRCSSSGLGRLSHRRIYRHPLAVWPCARQPVYRATLVWYTYSLLCS